MIQPRNVRYNVEVGRFLRKFEHYLYRGIDEIWNGPTVIKGYTVEQIGKIARDAWDSYSPQTKQFACLNGTFLRKLGHVWVCPTMHSCAKPSELL